VVRLFVRPSADREIEFPTTLEGTFVPRKKKAERKHNVLAHLANSNLTKAGTALTLEIRADQKLIGTIIIGRGSLRWSGHRHPKEKMKTINWTRFADMMDALAYPGARARRVTPA